MTTEGVVGGTNQAVTGLRTSFSPSFFMHTFRVFLAAPSLSSTLPPS